MQKLMNKKLFRKISHGGGFTLAELLVVIAILAILIAIAVPVFTHMVAEANLRVNQANVHSVRSAAVAHILTHLGDYDDSETIKLNQYMNDPNHGWIALAMVDNNGNISSLQVFALSNIGNYVEGIGTARKWDNHGIYYNGDDNFYPISDDVKKPFATVKPSMGRSLTQDGPKVYYVQAIVTDLKKDAA